MDYLGRARKVIEIEIEELKRLLSDVDESFVHAVDLLRDRLETRHKIVVMGVGKSYNVAHKIAATLNSTGATSVVLHSQNALHGDIGIVNEGDVALVLSYSGETSELLDILPVLKRFSVKIISLTGSAGSTLARNSDIVLNVHVEREACPLNLAPTSSTTNMLVLGDALAMVLLEARGFDAADFAKYHPNGDLGRRLLTKVTDIMRQDRELALIAPEDTVDTALEAINRCRSGAAVVVDPGRKLKGIFTQGDFSRAYQADRDVGEKPVSEFMTVDPVTISGEKLAAEVLHVLEEHRIDDLVVVNDKDQVIGLIDTQDLTRLKIL